MNMRNARVLLAVGVAVDGWARRSPEDTTAEGRPPGQTTADGSPPGETTAQAPELVLPDYQRTQFRLSSLSGQKVLIVTWSSW